MTIGAVHEIQGSSLLIRPNRSLPVAGIVVLFAALSAWALAVGIGFALAGAALILPFAALQVLIAGLLCRWFYRHLDDCELVTIEGDRIRVMKRRGRDVARYDFPRAWTRVRLDAALPGRGRGRLWMGSHGRFITLADEINDHDRALLARALQGLLRSGGGEPQARATPRPAG